MIGSLLGYVISRLKEISTWQGIVIGLTALGIHLTPEQASAIAAAGLSVFGAISVFLPQHADDGKK